MNKEELTKMFDYKFSNLSQEEMYMDGSNSYIEKTEDVKQFIFKTIILEIIKSLIDDESLTDHSNGRYNREMELRKKVKELGFNITL